jgi:hypothetical protein
VLPPGGEATCGGSGVTEAPGWPMDKRERTFLAVAAVFGLVLMLVLVYIGLHSENPEEAKLAALLRYIKAGQEKADARARAAIKDGSYMTIVHEIEAGRIAPASEGRADLPAAYGGLTVDDQVIVERRSDGRLLVVFPTWRGKGGNFSGYLYASRPLASGDFHETDWGSGGLRRETTIAGLDYVEAVSLHGPWYKVSRGVD